MGRLLHARRSQKGAQGCAVLAGWHSCLGGCTAWQLPHAVSLRWDGIWGSRAALARDVSHVAPLRRGYRGRPTPAKGVRATAHCRSRYWRDFYLPPCLGAFYLAPRSFPTTKGRVERRHMACCSPPFSLARSKITSSSTSLFLCYSAIVRLWI